MLGSIIMSNKTVLMVTTPLFVVATLAMSAMLSAKMITKISYQVLSFLHE